eukprot:174775_1
MQPQDLRLERIEHCNRHSCLKLLIPSSDLDVIMETDRYHPKHCNELSINHYHPFHSHLVKNNHRTGQGLEIIMNHHTDRCLDNIEWIKQYKQVPDTNIFVDAFECYHTIQTIMKHNSALHNVNEVLMNGRKPEQIIFILTHFHWNSYRGLEKYHRLIFNKHTRNRIYCSEMTAQLIRHDAKLRAIDPKYINILHMNQEQIVMGALPIQKRVAITALNANHVHGSIMCIFKIFRQHHLFDPNTVYHLHCGDCNLSKTDMVNDKDLWRILNEHTNRIDTMWIDTKSLSYWLQPLEHEECVRIITTQIVDKHMTRAQQTDQKLLIQIGKYTLGLERIVMDIAKHVRHTYGMKMCSKPKDVEHIKLCDDMNHDHNEYLQTPQQWTESKDKIQREYLEQLKAYQEAKRTNIERQKLFKVTNKSDYHLLFDDEDKTRFNVCAYCKKLHKKHRVYVDGELYWTPDICEILRMQSVTVSDMDKVKEETAGNEPVCWYNHAWVECVNTNMINFEHIQYGLGRYSMMVGVVVSSKCQRLEVEVSSNKQMMIYYVPYKQHSTKQDLRDFIKMIRPINWIYPLNDNFTPQSVQRQVYQLTYYKDELCHDVNVREDAHMKSEMSVDTCRQNKARKSNEEPTKVDRNQKERNKEKYPSYYYCNDDDEWISVYDEESVLSQNTINTLSQSGTKQTNHNVCDDQSSLNERNPFLEDDEKALELFE